MGQLAGKKVIVTGATSGIGQAIAIRAARDGADIAYCGIGTEGSETTTQAVEAAGQRAFFKAVNLADIEAAREFAREAIAFLGGVDGLVNNAGANLWHGVEHSTFEQLDTCLHVNFYHAWAIAQECYPSMKAAGGGIVVNMSSVNARGTLPGVFPYNMTKIMLVALTQSIAIELGRFNIRSVAIQPGLIMTRMADEYFDTFPDPAKAREAMLSSYPLNRGGTVDEVAATVAHLLSGENAFMSGNELLIDGGISTLLETPKSWL